MPEIAAFCQKWKITEFSLYGSVLRDDFGPGSDVDVLVTFLPDAPWSTFDVMDMEEELGALLCRKVDIAERSAVRKSRNQLRASRILNSSHTIYGA
ncbi:MAG: nucleotidyltransferase domain-containing protein [bacterium]|nr:nucleotidyltransferase domain-containing protein [bacterium]